MPEVMTPSQAAWAHFRGSIGVRIGLAILAVLVAGAVYAPFLSSEAALLWNDGSGWTSPVLGELFNRKTYAKPYDLVFNLFAVTLPFTLAIAWWFRGTWSWPRRILLIAGVPLVAALVMVVPIPRDDGGWRSLWRGYPPESRSLSAHLADPGTVRAVFTPIGHQWDQTYAGAVLKEPGTVNAATGRPFLLGTDSRGQDVLARMLFGGRISLTIGFVATGIAMAIGILIGAVSGYFGGWVDLLLQRIVEIMMCFPTFILILIVVSALGRDIFIIILVQGLTGWAGDARLVRGEVLVQSSRDYVLAGRALGLGRVRIMFRHILPNCMTPLLIGAVFGIAGAVLGESGLSFIGLGDPNAPSWGQLLNQGRENIHMSWLIWTPGLSVFALVSALYLVGNGLRAAFDPKAR